MRTRSSIAPITPPQQTLRRSPRFQQQNPKPTKAASKTNRNSTSVKKNCQISVKKAVKDAILRSGLRRSSRLNNWVGVSQPLRRSPRLAGQNCEDKAVKGGNSVSVNIEGDGELGGVVVRKCGDKGRKKVCEEELKGGVRGLRDGGGQVDVKGKKMRVESDEESDGVCEGWSREQEVALKKAYFAAQPTPHFWKKVARMVPGKSAQDCFDKINSDQATPLPRPPRSRTTKTKASSPAFSASKLLAPNEAKGRRRGCNKGRNQVAHKTLRALLEKQCRVKDGHGADLFSVLEPDVVPFIQGSQSSPQPSTPDHVEENGGALLRSRQRIAPITMIPLSSVNSLTGNAVSPPVLKQVKNKALHEKYIDLLRKREAKRNTSATKGGKVPDGKENRLECYVLNIDVRAAKNALVSDARDVISQFQSLRDDV